MFLKKEENYYPRIFLKISKYIEKEKKIFRYVTYDLKITSDDSDGEYKY